MSSSQYGRLNYELCIWVGRQTNRRLDLHPYNPVITKQVQEYNFVNNKKGNKIKSISKFDSVILICPTNYVYNPRRQ